MLFWVGNTIKYWRCLKQQEKLYMYAANVHELPLSNDNVSIFLYFELYSSNRVEIPVLVINCLFWPRPLNVTLSKTNWAMRKLILGPSKASAVFLLIYSFSTRITFTHFKSSFIACLAPWYWNSHLIVVLHSCNLHYILAWADRGYFMDRFRQLNPTFPTQSKAPFASAEFHHHPF